MSEPKRMTFTSREVGGGETGKTEWVSLADYARLKAENERLRKAGDAMAVEVNGRYFGKRLIKEWNAAKEGKQS